MADAVIAVRGLRKRYGQHDAVKGIDFSVDAGEVFGCPRGRHPHVLVGAGGLGELIAEMDRRCGR